MKKIFKIARYDFKRIILNPITLISMLVVLILCCVLGGVVPFTKVQEYSANTLGNSAEEIYSNFISGKSVDKKNEIEEIVNHAEKIIEIQENLNKNLDETEDFACPEYDEISSIISEFKVISIEIEKYSLTKDCAYSDDISTIKSATSRLTKFVNDYKAMSKFESGLVLTKKNIENLSNLATYFAESISTSPKKTLDTLSKAENLGKFDELEKAIDGHFIFLIGKGTLSEFRENYIDKSRAKMLSIYREMNTILQSGTASAQDMESLVTNFKLTAESAGYAVEQEFEMLLSNHPVKNLYNHENFSKEEVTSNVAKVKFFLEDDGLYYTKYQVPLNFHISSYQKTAFDYAYFVMAIVGFLTVIFGIFCAYKLFGQDRKNGKLDLILSQNVTFSQVFAGKFLSFVFCTSAIVLCYGIISLIVGLIFYSIPAGSILAVFNLSTAYTIVPFAFYLIKLVGIELQVIFYGVLTIFLMNISRKFNAMFAVSLLIFAVACVCNIFLSNQIWYCLLPFIHSDLTSMIGYSSFSSGFLMTSIYASGNFFISMTYFFVMVMLFYNFTKHLFKKN